MAALQRPAFNRLRSINRVDEKDKLDGYPEIVGTVTSIRGKAVGGLEEMSFGTFSAGSGATLDCFGGFSVGVGEDVLGRSEDCPIGAATKSGARAGS